MKMENNQNKDKIEIKSYHEKTLRYFVKNINEKYWFKFFSITSKAQDRCPFSLSSFSIFNFLILPVNRVFLFRHCTIPNNRVAAFLRPVDLVHTVRTAPWYVVNCHLVTWLILCFECNFQFEVTLNIYYNVIFTSHFLCVSRQLQQQQQH